MNKHILVILKGFPRLSETFILQELLALEAAGFELTLYALKGAREEIAHDDVKKLKAKVFYQDPQWDYEDEKQVALCLDRVAPFDLIYAHFLHDPATFALKLALKTKRPLVASGHAVDIYTTDLKRLQRVISGARKIFVCHPHGYHYLTANFPDDREKIFEIPHGVSITDFNFNATDRDEQHLLTVGRLVNKKGHRLVLKALAQLQQEGHHFRYTIVGDGVLKDELQELVTELGLQEKVQFLGALTRLEILPLYQSAGVMVLAPQVSDDGDRDGIPNVILEAMASGVSVVCAEFAALAQVTIPGQSARVFKGDVESLVVELKLYWGDSMQERQQRRLAAREWMERNYDSRQHLRKIVDLLRQELS